MPVIEAVYDLYLTTGNRRHTLWLLVSAAPGHSPWWFNTHTCTVLHFHYRLPCVGVVTPAVQGHNDRHKSATTAVNLTHAHTTKLVRLPPGHTSIHLWILTALDFIIPFHQYDSTTKQDPWSLLFLPCFFPSPLSFFPITAQVTSLLTWGKRKWTKFCGPFTVCVLCVLFISLKVFCDGWAHLMTEP